MKIKLLTIVLLLVAFNLIKAQAPVFKEATLSHPVDLWKPFHIDSDGKNIVNGVQIYYHDLDCNSEKINTVKLINTNPYKITLRYQLSESSPDIEVTVPALSSLEGICNSTDNNIKKLLLSIPVRTEEEMLKMNEYIKSHLSVKPVK